MPKIPLSASLYTLPEPNSSVTFEKPAEQTACALKILLQAEMFVIYLRSSEEKSKCALHGSTWAPLHFALYLLWNANKALHNEHLKGC